MKMTDVDLNDLVKVSTLTFIGTVKQLDNSDVSGIGKKDFPAIVQVDSIVSADQQALKTFGDLRGTNLTVALNPVSRIVMQNNMPAVFFADPLIYEKSIGVVATAVPIPDIKEDFLNKLHAAAVQKSEAPLRTEIAGAELIITGDVESVEPLASDKAAHLQSVDNDWSIFSEHRPKWMKAVIEVKSIEKPKPPKPTKPPKPAFVTIVFPATHDCFLGPSPKFQVSQSGIWLLHRDQLNEQEKKVLLTLEKSKHGDIQSYTALAPADSQDLATLDLIKRIIAETSRRKAPRK